MFVTIIIGLVSLLVCLIPSIILFFTVFRYELDILDRVAMSIIIPACTAFCVWLLFVIVYWLGTHVPIWLSGL